MEELDVTVDWIEKPLIPSYDNIPFFFSGLLSDPERRSWHFLGNVQEGKTRQTRPTHACAFLEWTGFGTVPKLMCHELPETAIPAT
jgi:hypothetical protein